jgi:hypothetical protein
MPITFIEPKRRKYYLILLLVVVVIGVLFLIWNYFFLKAPLPISKPTPPREIKINFETLEKPFLIESQPFEGIPFPSPGAKDVSLTPTLSWQSVPGAEIYVWEIIGVKSDQTEQTSVTISKPLNTSTTYVWRVKSCNKDMSECGAWSGDCQTGGEVGCWRFTTIAHLPLILVSPSPGAKDVSLTPTLSWQNVSGAETYFWNLIGIESGQTSSTSVSISKKLEPSTTYVWRVKSCNKDMSECGAWGVGTFTTISGLLSPELISPPIEKIFIGRENPFAPYSEIKPAE